MAVQLEAGQAPAFRQARRGRQRPTGRRSRSRSGSTSPGSTSRVYPLPVKPGIYAFLKAGKGVGHVGGGRVLRRERDRGGVQAVGRGQVGLPRVRHERAEGGQGRRDDQRLAHVPQRRARDRQEGQCLSPGEHREGRRREGVRPCDQPRPHDVPRLAHRRVDADLRRHMALVPRLLLRREHARARLEGHRREVPRAAARPQHARRPQLAAVADGGRAVRVAHLRRRAATSA